ncbi:unnamed protein product [Effrenium voratum]|nr:unnamed protein product [Effrenium voratum]
MEWERASLRSPSRASRTPIKRSGPRAGEALSFTPLRRGRPPEVALAGLRIFCIERFGGLRPAFERMDFHRDGHVSCLEFQEVVAGQERYCSLQEAREIFCLLARGTSGWLSWEVFRRRLHGGEWQDAGSDCSPSQSSERSSAASHAMRALLLREKGQDNADAETVATARSMTSPSSVGLTPCRGRLERLEPKEQKEPKESKDKGPPLAGRELARRLLQGALQDSQSGRAGQVPAGDALQQLDRGLSSLQAEVAILKQMGADSARVGFETPPRRQGASDTLTGRVLGSPQPRWLQGLDYAAQGRVAACGSRAEALQVLEEAAEPEFSGQAPEEPKEASYEQIAAALALLQQAKDRVAKLEAQRNDAWKRHQEEVAALRASLEKQRRESLQRLLLRLAPPGFRKPCPGSLASPVPTPRRARKAAQVVEQGRPEPVTQAASLGDSSG